MADSPIESNKPTVQGVWRYRAMVGLALIASLGSAAYVDGVVNRVAFCMMAFFPLLTFTRPVMSKNLYKGLSALLSAAVVMALLYTGFVLPLVVAALIAVVQMRRETGSLASLLYLAGVLGALAVASDFSQAQTISADLFCLSVASMGVILSIPPVSAQWLSQATLLRVGRDGSYEDMSEHVEGLEVRLRSTQRMEQNLRDAVAASEAASKAKSQFLAQMSHELRTPLNAIIGYSELMIEEMEEDDDDTYVEDLDRIQRAGRHLLTLINDILDLSKVEAGALQLRREWVDISTLLNDIAGTVMPKVNDSGSMMIVDIEPEIGKLHTDELRLSQILLNLLSNAAKFTHDGMIFLNAKRVTVDDVECMRFDVRDTGIGISDEQLIKLFQPFVQADISISHEYGGTGLGLYLCEQFAHMMEGSIEVESALGEGSTFSLLLPVKTLSAEISEMEAERFSGAAYTTFPVVACLDPDPRSLDLMIRKLDTLGLYAVPLQDESKLRELAEKVELLAVTLDVVDGGWQLLESLTKNPVGGKLVVISSDDDIEESALMRGVDYHVVKPVNRLGLIRIFGQFAELDLRVPNGKTGTMKAITTAEIERAKALATLN